MCECKCVWEKRPHSTLLFAAPTTLSVLYTVVGTQGTGPSFFIPSSHSPQSYWRNGMGLLEEEREKWVLQDSGHPIQIRERKKGLGEPAGEENILDLCYVLRFPSRSLRDIITLYRYYGMDTLHGCLLCVCVCGFNKHTGSRILFEQYVVYTVHTILYRMCTVLYYSAYRYTYTREIRLHKKDV